MSLNSVDDLCSEEIIPSLDIIIHQEKFAKRQIKNDMDLQTFQSTVTIETEILRMRERLPWRENHRKKAAQRTVK
jgi:hypothetical protein